MFHLVLFAHSPIPRLALRFIWLNLLFLVHVGIQNPFHISWSYMVIAQVRQDNASRYIVFDRYLYP